jgi:CheY-like chemotaxis protein
MEASKSDDIRKAVFRILELVHGQSDLNIMFNTIQMVIADLIVQMENTSPVGSLLVSRIDHDLRTPLCGIQGFAELLCEELKDPESKKKAENILVSAKRLTELLDGLLHESSDVPFHIVTKPEVEQVEEYLPSLHKGNLVNGNPAVKRKKSAGKILPNVLIVEDNLVNIQLLMIYIRRYCNIFSTQNARSAIQLTSEQHFDAILMDIHLGPGMDGIQAMQEIRKQPGNGRIPIIAVTGYATLGDRERFLNDGFTEYVKKPIDRDEIRVILERIFRD